MVPAADDPLALLTRTERLWYRVADLFARRLWFLSVAWNRFFMVSLVFLLAGRRIRLHGLEHLDAFTSRDRLILVANHRSFFDFFLIGAMLYTRTHLSKRILFPVRAPFFYDRLVGGFVNAIMSAFTMFPPIVRDDRREFNLFALKRCIEALNEPGQLIGIHPEGTRGTGPDPYEFLRAQPGVGKIVLDAPEVPVVPIFVIGLSNRMGTELRNNLLAPADHPIDVWFGPPVALDEVRARGKRATSQLIASKRCMEAIAALADEHRRHTRAEAAK